MQKKRISARNGETEKKTKLRKKTLFLYFLILEFELVNFFYFLHPSPSQHQRFDTSLCRVFVVVLVALLPVESTLTPCEVKWSDWRAHFSRPNARPEVPFWHWPQPPVPSPHPPIYWPRWPLVTSGDSGLPECFACCRFLWFGPTGVFLRGFFSWWFFYVCQPAASSWSHTLAGRRQTGACSGSLVNPWSHRFQSEIAHRGKIFPVYFFFFCSSWIVSPYCLQTSS